MGRMNIVRVMVLLCIIALAFSGCDDDTASPDGDGSELGGYEGKKILVVHSYHRELSGVIGKNGGLKNILDEVDIEYTTIYMDTKRNPDEEFAKEAALDAKETIEQYKPDVVITFDDNAFRHLIMPYYRDSEIPVVFAGIDWDASIYGTPYTNTTGMVSVALVAETIDYLERYAGGNRVGWLGYDTFTARKQTKAYKDILKLSISEHYVNDFEEWKSKFLELQTEVDMVIHSGLLQGMEDWDNAEAKEFVLNNIRVPIGTVNKPMMPHSVFGLAKGIGENGEWAAQTALRILDGTDPSDIPETTNKEATIMVNLDLAERLDIIFPPEILKNAEVYE